MPALSDPSPDRVELELEPAVKITASWDTPRGYERLDRWQVRLLQRWADQDDADGVARLAAGEVEPHA